MEKLTAEDIPRLAGLRSRGARDKDLASVLGVNPSTFSRWLNHPQTELQCQLGNALKKAETERKLHLLDVVAKAAEVKDWRAACWLLERTYPEEYAQTRRIAVDAHSESDVDIQAKLSETLGKIGFI